ncbi:NAD-specific glutamate dehydrogenase-domain-containing protein [Jimgerdemannia flammicorona]|uniref:NAD-specific glutamate dehydrogenase-domain-containing protein n=2 Tax=Jimgerdemannia flammicorona TaxID=994334 RepID=A0A433QHP1_9FUNG|nr:NAD-specific glutamate dehydrogenase-domain-containing protein [Jimgerdemannia flammicorona]RUS29340.1 NAD-specific glutamate dehydrogenase-domain-containing protein [Jimgerdemannia flammicorona]
MTHVERRLDLVDVVLQILLSLYEFLLLLVLILERLGVLDHTLDIGGGETTGGIGDGDVGLAAGRLVLGGDLENTVGIEIEGAEQFGLAAGHGGDAGELELAEKVVLLGHETLTLVDGEGDGSLTVNGGGENLGLLARDGAVAGHDHGHDATLHLNAEREGHDVEEEEILGLLVGGLVSEDGSLNSSAVSDGLIGIDGLVELLAIEEVLEEGLNLGNTGGTADEDDLLDVLLVDLGVLKDTTDRVDDAVEVGGVEFLELGTSDVSLEINAIEEGVDFD